MMISPSIQFVFSSFIFCNKFILSRTSTSSPLVVIQPSHDKQQTTIKRCIHKLEFVEETKKTTRKNSYKPVPVIKQARKLKRIQ
jgi:hypothetical protein